MEITQQTEPLVSCLCITKNRLDKLRRSINCFLSQSYRNRELVLIYEHENRNSETALWINGLNDPRIKIVAVSSKPKLSLGELRNLSLSKAAGEYFCQWDDDDWYHQDRLKIQLTHALVNKQPATFLTNWLMFDEENHAAFFSQFRLWEGSILCKRAVFPLIKYPAQSKAEDWSFLNQLLRTSKVFPVVCPNLYIYTFHGENTWDKHHFQRLFDKCQKLSTDASTLIENILSNKYDMNQASHLLSSDPLLDELNYFYFNKLSSPNPH